jgi:surfactin synthase thioesterase subunit
MRCRLRAFFKNFVVSLKRVTNHVTPLSLLFSCASCTTSPSVSDFRSFSISVTGGEFCLPDKILPTFTFKMLTMDVSADPDICTAWIGIMYGTTAISGQVNLATGRRPFVFYANNASLKDGSKIERVIVKIVGGPGVPAGPYGHEAAYLGYSSVPTMMVSLGYTGTIHNSFYPNENFTPATTELIELTTKLCKKHPDAELLLIGESLGGALATSIDPKLTECPLNRKTLLISPMVDSATESLNYILRNEEGKKKAEGKVFLHIIDTCKDCEEKTTDMVTSRNIIATFFPENERNKSLSQRLESESGRAYNTHFIFGSNDTVINPKTVSQITDNYKTRSTMIDGMGHVSGKQYEKQIADIIETIFSKSKPSN